MGSARFQERLLLLLLLLLLLPPLPPPPLLLLLLLLLLPPPPLPLLGCPLQVDGTRLEAVGGKKKKK